MTVEAAERLVEFPALKEAREGLNAKRDELASILKEAGPEYDMKLVKSVPGDTKDKVAKIGELNKDIDERKTKVDELLVVARAAAVARDNEAVGEKGSEVREPAPDTKDRRPTKQFGDLIVESDAIKGYRPGAGVGPASRIDVDLNHVLKADFTRTTGWDPEDTRTGRMEMFPTRPAPHVADAFPQTTTNMSTVLYMEETTYVNTNAAEVDEGGPYLEASLALTEKSSEVRKIAVFLPVTDEQFEDEPRARTYVQNRLPFMIQQRLDSQLLVGSGAGTPAQLLGTENVVGIQTQALGADPVPDAVYKVMRKIREDGFAEPSVVFLTPAKWEGVRLLRTADGQYIWGHPAIPGPETIWGVPVVQTTAVTSTKAVVGDYTNFSELAVRRGLDVQISNSHSDYFIKGKLAIRADVRCAVIHYRPKAFGTVTGL